MAHPVLASASGTGISFLILCALGLREPWRQPPTCFQIHGTDQTE